MLFLLLSCSNINLNSEIKAGPAEGDAVAYDSSQTASLVEILKRPIRRKYLFGEARDEIEFKQGEYAFKNQNELELCLKNKADPNVLVYDYTALHCAVLKQNEAAVNLLLKYGAKIDHEKYNEHTLMQLAISKGDLTSLSIILRYLSQLNTAIDQKHMHIGKGRALVSDTLKDFLNDISENLIDFTMNSGVQWYLDFAMDGDIEDIEETLTKLKLELKVKILRLLVQYGTKATEATDIWLMRAAGNGHVGIVNLLIKAGADINKSDVTGKTALISAAKNGHDKVVKILLEAGAEVDRVSNAQGITALMFAVIGGGTKKPLKFY